MIPLSALGVVTLLGLYGWVLLGRPEGAIETAGAIVHAPVPRPAGAAA